MFEARVSRVRRRVVRAAALLLASAPSVALEAQTPAAEAALLSEVRLGYLSAGSQLSFSPDGRSLAVAEGWKLGVWDIEARQWRWKKDPVFTPLCNLVLIASFAAMYASSENVNTGKDDKVLVHAANGLIWGGFGGGYICASLVSSPEGTPEEVLFSSDGRLVALRGKQGSLVMDATNGRRVRDTGVLQRLAWRPSNETMSADGRFAARIETNGVQVEVRYNQELLGQHPAVARSLAGKSDFETTRDFERRLASGQRAYLALARGAAVADERIRGQRVAESRRRVTLPASVVRLGSYDADRREFPLTVDGLDIILELRPGDAQALSERRAEIVVEAVEQLSADLTTVERLNLQLVHPTTLRKYPVGPQVVLRDVAAVATRPAVLEISAPRFTDTDGDNRLSAGERAVLEFTLRNSGEGPGQGLRVVGTGSAPIDGLSASIGRIEPGESKRVTLTLTGGAALRDGTAVLQLEVKEANGFHAAPLAVSVPTRAFRPPVLQVAEVGVEDAQGRAVIRTGQLVTLTLRVRNVGEGRATAVVADVVPGAGVSLAETPDPRRAVLRVGDLEAGAFRDVRVTAFANAEVRERFPVSVTLRESSGRFASARDLGLTLETPQRSVAQLEVSAREQAPTTGPAGAAAAPRLASDLLERIPAARRENPNAIAVIIGNRSYQNAPSVAFAANDAAVMRQYAERTLGIKPGNVIYMEDATLTNMQVVFGREGDVSGRLRDLVKRGESEVFVFYSGHGAPDPRAERAYLMPVDADASRLGLTGFSVDVLYANLAALGAKHVTVVLDACFSGATGGGEMLITEASPIGIRVTDPAARFAGGSATIFAASQGQQLANWYAEKRHGLFTYFFLKGLQGSADADRDGAVTLGEMRNWLTDPRAGVPYESRRLYGTNREQVPQVWGDSARRIR